MSGPQGFVLVLTGGIGGAKLCLGLQRVLPANSVRIAVNTGDDFEHLGLRISPDIDTTIYTLSGREALAEKVFTGRQTLAARPG